MKYSDINLYTPIVCDRMISDYYMLEGVLGNKKYSYDEVNFIIKSWVMFLEEFIKNTKLVFSGYPDNLISHFTYILADFFHIKCLSYHPINLIKNTNYLSDDIYHKVYDKLIINENSKTYTELIEYTEKANIKDLVRQEYKHSKGVEKPLFGIISPNLKKVNFWKYVFFGYQTENKEIKKYLEIDRVSFKNKFLGYLRRLYNIFTVKIYFAVNKHNLPEDMSGSIYFPLQVQPEASTSVTSSLFMNLISTIELVSKSLPLGYLLVVKEHPMVKGTRNISFYKKIKSFSNVILVDTKYNGKYLIQNSECIIGYGNTTLQESVMLGKKFFLLEDTFYSDSKLIRRLQDIKNMKNEILTLINKNFTEEEKKFEIQKMLNFFYQRGFPRYEDFEKNISKNLMRAYEIELLNKT